MHCIQLNTIISGQWSVTRPNTTSLFDLGSSEVNIAIQSVHSKRLTGQRITRERERERSDFRKESITDGSKK